MFILLGFSHWLSTWLGLTNASGPIYSFWSGWFGDISILAIPVVLLRKHQCHSRGCWRIGRYPVEGTGFVVCRKCHPETDPDVQHTRTEIHRIWHERKAKAEDVIDKHEANQDLPSSE